MCCVTLQVVSGTKGYDVSRYPDPVPESLESPEGSSHQSIWPGLICKQSNPVQTLGWEGEWGTQVASYLSKAGVNTIEFQWLR